MDSIFPVSVPRKRNVDSNVVAGGETATFYLNRDEISEEHIVFVDFSQVFTAAPTAIDTDRVGELVESVKLAIAGPQADAFHNVSGISLNLLNRMFEDAHPVTYTLGTNTTVRFALEVHHANPGAKRDLVAALNAIAATQAKLDVKLASDSSNVLTGGSGAGAITATVRVASVGYEADSLLNAHAELGDEGETLANAVSAGAHIVESHSASSSGAGSITIDLTVGGRVRGIMLETETGGALSDVAVGDVRLMKGSEEISTLNFKELRDETVKSRGVDIPGVALIDFGDDESGWLDLRDVTQVKLQLSALAAATVRVTEDHTK